MRQPVLLQDLIESSAAQFPGRLALVDGDRSLDYAALSTAVRQFAAGLSSEPGFERGARVAVWLENRLETVVACFGTAAAGGIFVPVNPALKAEQVLHVLRDAGAWRLVTASARYARLGDDVPESLLVDRLADPLRPWSAATSEHQLRSVDLDTVVILYTSGSTGRPKGVVLSHRNMVAGAVSVASYLGNGPEDVLLAMLPLSFDAGFSQLTTAFHAGATVVLHNHLLAGATLDAIDRHAVTGITAVPPLYFQLLQVKGSTGSGRTLRYFATTGGRMPHTVLHELRARWPNAQPFLMYGLTESFRSTFLPPTEVDRRPDSIGKAVPNAEILVLRQDGTPCDVDEPGELVHRGPFVAQGYWRNPQATSERFRPLPAWVLPPGRVMPELAVYSGDTVRRDAEGFLYFVGRSDEQIKTSGYRVSPTEVEEVLYATRLVGECVAFGVDHMQLGQAIQVIATPPGGADAVDVPAVLAECKRRMPAYMVPADVQGVVGPLPRNPNGKIDRKLLSENWIKGQGV